MNLSEVTVYVDGKEVQIPMETFDVLITHGKLSQSMGHSNYRWVIRRGHKILMTTDRRKSQEKLGPTILVAIGEGKELTLGKSDDGHDAALEAIKNAIKHANPEYDGKPLYCCNEQILLSAIWRPSQSLRLG